MIIKVHPNGLKTVKINVSKGPFITSLFIKPGSSSETPNNSGITHLAEHLIVNNLPLKLRNKFIGGYTSKEFMCLHFRSNKKIKFNLPKFCTELRNFDNEKLRVLEEFKYDEIHHLIDKHHHQLLPNGYKLPVLGNIKNILKLSINDISQFINNYLKPINMVIIKIGPFKSKSNEKNKDSTKKNKDSNEKNKDSNEIVIKDNTVKENNIIKAADTVKENTVKGDNKGNTNIKENNIIKAADTVKENNIIKGDNKGGATSKETTIKKDTVKENTVKGDNKGNTNIKKENKNQVTIKRKIIMPIPHLNSYKISTIQKTMKTFLTTGFNYLSIPMYLQQVIKNSFKDLKVFYIPYRKFGLFSIYGDRKLVMKGSKMMKNIFNSFEISEIIGPYLLYKNINHKSLVIN